jgi:hypothetical protein
MRVPFVEKPVADARDNADLGPLQPLAKIELDEDDIAHLTSSRVHPNQLAAFHERWKSPGQRSRLNSRRWNSERFRSSSYFATFFVAAHRLRCASAILARPSGLMVPFFDF